jgi:hypothetical protein
VSRIAQTGLGIRGILVSDPIALNPRSPQP